MQVGFKIKQSNQSRVLCSKMSNLKKKIKNQSYKGVDSQAVWVQNQLLSLFQFFLGINTSL